tara:strand:+ start:42745 stop:43542 length:798 start_codon:yes stop_codon:yes gene_type:complete
VGALKHWGIMANFKTRVLGILGQDNSDYLSDIADMPGIVTNSLWEMAQVLPTQFLLSESVSNPVDIENLTNGQTAPSDDVDIADTIVLLVIRVSAGPHIVNSENNITEEVYLTRPCKQINIEESHKALDSNSIYFATDLSPVYWIENGNKLKTAPATTGYTANSGVPNGLIMPDGKSGLNLYKYTRQVFTDATWETASSFTGIPEGTEDLICKRIAVEVLNQKILNAGTQDEDQEIVQILQANRTLLSEDIGNQVKLLNDLWETK